MSKPSQRRGHFFKVLECPPMEQNFCVIFDADMNMVYGGPIGGSGPPPHNGTVLLSSGDCDRFQRLSAEVLEDVLGDLATRH